MENKRLKEILNNCLEYITELKERESDEEREEFYECVLGITEEEMRELDLKEPF